jgi:hypothetical protein
MLWKPHGYWLAGLLNKMIWFLYEFLIWILNLDFKSKYSLAFNAGMHCIKRILQRFFRKLVNGC